MSQADDERELDRRGFLKCMAWVGTPGAAPRVMNGANHPACHHDLIFERITIVRKYLSAAALAASMFVLAACGSYGSSSPSGPSGSPPPADAITINVVRENGNQSFSPNPATVPTGQTVVWHNIDTTTHRVVLNDGRLDTGNLPPGAFSQPMTLGAPGPYHCSIHPDMVGTLVSQ